MRPRNSPPRFLPRRNGNIIHIKTLSRVRVLATISPNCKQPKCCSLTGEWTKCGAFNTGNNCYLAIQRKRSSNTAWMNIKTIILSERRQSQKTTYCLILFIWHVGRGKSIETGNRLLVARGWGWEWGVIVKDHEVWD